MGLFNRLGTLAKADAHGVVDVIEDRALTLRQHLRDARAELDSKRCHLAGLAVENKDLQSEAARLDRQIKTLEEDITLALQNSKEDLARFSIKKLLPLRRTRQAITQRLQELGGEQRDVEKQLVDQEQAFEDLERRVKAHLAQQEQTNRARPFIVDWMVSDEDVELELLRRQRDAEEGGVS